MLIFGCFDRDWQSLLLSKHTRFPSYIKVPIARERKHLSERKKAPFLSSVGQEKTSYGIADNLAVYFQGSWGAEGGTSAAAPIWAAGQALVNEDTMQRLGTFGYSPRFYYAVADKHTGGNAYFDVTSGNNQYYPATTGWDYTTGLGTPNLPDFDEAVSNIQSSALTG